MNNRSLLDSYKDAYGDSFKYALDNRLMLNWYADRILKVAQGQSLLELGVGHGFTTLKFSERFKRHLVVDGSAEVITKFRKQQADCKVEIAHSLFEEFCTEEKFDVIVMGFILEHVQDPALILRRFLSFLKEKGSIFVAVPNSEALNKRFGYEAGMISDMSQLSQADKELGHHRLFNVPSLRRMVKASGYKVRWMEGILLKPITTQQMLDMHLPESILQAMLKVGIQYPELSVGILMEIEPA